MKFIYIEIIQLLLYYDMPDNHHGALNNANLELAKLLLKQQSEVTISQLQAMYLFVGLSKLSKVIVVLISACNVGM